VVVVAGTVVVVVGAVVAVVAAVLLVAWPWVTLPRWTVVDVDAAAVVVVAPPTAVVVVEAGAVVVVVVTATFSAGSVWRTPRNRSSAVWPTMFRAFSRSFTPGRSMMMLLPCRLISGSATPSESTRLRMMLTA
jgi:hypothetical protein